MRKITSIVISILIIMMSLTACQFGTSSPQDKLNAYIKSTEFEEHIDLVRNSFGSMLDVNVSSKGTDIVFDFVYRTQIPSESVSAVKDSLSTSLSYLSSNFKKMIIIVEEELVLENVRIVVNIKNTDGTNIMTVIYTEKGVEGLDITESIVTENSSTQVSDVVEEPTIGDKDVGNVTDGTTSEENPAPKG